MRGVFLTLMIGARIMRPGTPISISRIVKWIAPSPIIVTIIGIIPIIRGRGKKWCRIPVISCPNLIRIC